jgi:hypothetical protein
LSDLPNRLKCLDTLACILPAGPATSCVRVEDGNYNGCYCGTVPTGDCLKGVAPTGMFGPCKGFMDVGFPGQSPSSIAMNMRNPMYSPGRAMRLASCLHGALEMYLDERCRSCF